MPSIRNSDRMNTVTDIIRRYVIVERALRSVILGVIVSLFVGTYLLTSLLPAVAVSAGVTLLLYAPVIKPQGTVQLETAADADTVADSFNGPTPPILAFHWGLADQIHSDGPVTQYQISYLLGARSLTMTVETRAVTTPEGTQQVELDVSTDSTPWAQYRVVAHPHDQRTVVEYEYRASRRFGVLRLFQRLLANWYRDDVLSAQNYALCDRQEQYLSVAVSGSR